MQVHLQHRYEAKIKRSAELDRSYSAVAKLINCEPDEVAIVTSATTAWFQVHHPSCALQAKLSNCIIVTTVTDLIATLMPSHYF